MAQKLAFIMFVVIGLLAIQTLYLVECSKRDRGRQTNNPYPCRQLCKGRESVCGGPCPNCRGGPWTPYECASK
uniref:Putative 5.3 kDa protein n=1 Tax=Ixodes ricinus TaxID=34613 RepID=A0A0K8R6M6_IXORI